MRQLAALTAALLLTTACSSHDRRSTTTSRAPTSATHTTAATQSSGSAASLAATRVKFTPVGSFEQPLALAVHPGDQTIFIAQRTGKVRALAGGQTALDLTALVTSAGQEQGLLGLTFSPDGSHLIVDYTDQHGDTRVVEYAFRKGQVDVATRRELLFVEQPYPNHNGGNVVFGPDGKLWIGLGDGGSGGDPHGNGQNLGVLLGKLLRVDPTPSGSLPYTIPSDNPFVGTRGARGEIWAYGLRNPWRFEFDRATHDLWIGDVGQNAWEEIDWRPASSHGGENYGWNRLEGTHSYSGAPPAGSVAPVEEYHHDGGACSVTGGFVYRGARIPGLTGAYLYADFCVGQVRALRLSGGAVVERKDLSVTLRNLSSFGEDGNGELYALSLDGAVDRIDPA